MNKRTFALLTAVLTFSVGVVLAKLSLPNLLKTPPPVVVEVQLSNYRVSGPYQFEHLSIYLVHSDAPDSRPYVTLQDAVESKMVTVHETNHVNELTIENISGKEDVFVQAGDIVKGGRQDRVLAVDMILPASSGVVPISAFCVEQSRWQARGVESTDHFTMTEMAANYSVLQAIVDVATQVGVWDEVKDTHENVGAGVARDVRSDLSPTSLPLALENEDVKKSTEPYIKSLSSLVTPGTDVVGFAFAINDEIKSADVYSSNLMFARLWPRLLKATALEAVATPPIKRAPEALSAETVGEFLINAELGAETVSEVNSRTQSAKRETACSLFFETRDRAYNGLWVHRSYLRRIKPSP